MRVGIGRIRAGRTPARTSAVLALLVFAVWGQSGNMNSTPPAARSGYVGSAACARCHAAIYESYQHTPMAQASGPANAALTPAEFTHRESGVHYRIYDDNGRVWLAFDRPSDPEVRGKRELLYFLGSGRRGRTYLFETDGFLFESPVNWYANKQMWDMAPAYQSSREIPLNLPAYSSCLHCHMSGMQAPAKGTENRYPDPPFTQNGVSCERCHGPAAGHVAGGAILNPAKLTAVRRDEVCMQCHLEGKVAIERAGRHVYEYRPGDVLADYIRYFVLVGSEGKSLGAVSQVEALAQSECKKKSGDVMTCTTCHDPHSTTSAGDRSTYYRGKCLGCHGAAFGDRHHPDHQDCLGCHMPASLSADVAHTQVTDHRIPRQPHASQQLPHDPVFAPSLPRLVSFPALGKNESDLRELALAWGSLAESTMPEREDEAHDLLEKAVKQSPADAVLLSALGFSEQKRGHKSSARALYQKALAIDPTLIEAETNLGVIEAQSGQVDEALRLWLAAFQNAPDKSSIGLNIARANCAKGKFSEARTSVMRVLEFNPDLDAAKQMLQHLNRVPSGCGP